MKSIYKLSMALLLFVFISNDIKAYSLRQFTSKNGLSNSAILSIFQDEKGFMWFGSCDGLNMFDGLNIQVYKPTNGNNNLSGNLIENIAETEKDILWVQTNYGLDRFDKRRKTIKSFKEFKSKNRYAQSKDNDIYIIEDNYLSYYNPRKEQFEKIFIKKRPLDNVIDMVMDTNNVLWIFANDGKCQSFLIKKRDTKISLYPISLFKHDKQLTYCFHEKSSVYFIDNAYRLYEYDLLSKKKRYIYNLQREMHQHGEVSAIIKHHNDFYIGFKTSGLLRLKKTSGQNNSYEINEIGIKSGIFCLVKDKFQDVIWVGTDGQGVYMYFIDSYSLKSTLFNSLAYPINSPVRALLLDKNKTLWIGTKGDGILKADNYDFEKSLDNNVDHLLSDNSLLNDNSVYVFAKSRKNILWIGSDNGINYYSYKEKKIKKLDFKVDNHPVRYVHSICEFNDTTLWIATVGEGIIKAKLSGNSEKPVITRAKRIIIDGGKRACNYFFTSFKENDSIIWFGNRGYGAFKLNTVSGKFDIHRFDKNNNNQTLNDIFSILKNNEGYWFGTSFGLTRLHNGKEQVFNEKNGFPNNTIHGILEDSHNNLWLSTNQGVVKFNLKQMTFQTYKQQSGLEVTEFSDGAFYKDESTGTLLFGGINGFITISENDFSQTAYSPTIQFNKLSIFGKEYNIFNFLTRQNDKEVLELNYEQNFFSVSFTAIDYINGNNYTYLYKLNELSDNWIENGNSNTAAFTNISPGKYTLLVKYRNNITGKESPAYSLIIKIRPPWYRTNLAYLIYIILFALLVYASIRMSVKWFNLKRSSMIERLNRQQREEIYESKLRFFTNITHELCTPLTLIYGPCEKIISRYKSDAYINKYATLILHNAEKLNALIQELIEFRRLESGHKSLDIRKISVSELTANIADSFTELAESKDIDYQIEIDENVFWNSDSNCLSKIITNLISNAFKYAFEHGKIGVKLFIENDALSIHISNTGKGIKEEQLAEIFDRYKILDDFEVQSKKGLSARNGLGLAICHSMVKLLEGEILVTSVPNELTVFKVLLPSLSVSVQQEDVPDEELSIVRPEIPVTFENTQKEYNKSKPTIMIVDDDPSMLWFVSEIFTEKYNVISIQDPKEVMEYLKYNQTNLIISDIMMPDIDGISLTKAIKSDKLLCHIPLILLSAKQDTEEQVKGIESGAEVYITKPFNVEYLEKIVDHFIQRNKDLKEYYGSILSSFELDDGRFMHKEDKVFFEKMLKTIEVNIANPDLSVEFLSSDLGYSTRQLYRKLKEITDKTPKDIIKEYRLKMVEQLLITTNLSIDEILYQSGFVNRGNFFKLFSKEYGMTPRSYREQKKKDFQDVVSPAT